MGNYVAVKMKVIVNVGTATNGRLEPFKPQPMSRFCVDNPSKTTFQLPRDKSKRDKAGLWLLRPVGVVTGNRAKPPGSRETRGREH